MVRVTAVLMMVILQASASTWTQSPQTQTLVITRGGSRPVEPGPEANFTGSVRVERLFEAVDPSHASGHAYMVSPLARAGVAVGADGLIIEVHPRPEEALCDGAQALTRDQYVELFEQTKRIFDVTAESVSAVAEVM